MSLKLDIETQAAALKAYDEQDFLKAIEIFQTIAETSKIHTNIGLIYATLGEHETAVDSFNAATELDPYLAVAYFQCGVSNFLLGRFEFAFKDFEEAFLYLRDNENINYAQLGLQFKLYSAEVIFNMGLCQIYLGNLEAGLKQLNSARQQKVTPEHDVIDDAIRDRGEEYTVFSIPVGVLYRPSEAKLKNAKQKDYLGKAKLISAADVNDEFVTFTGITRARQGLLPSGAPITELNRSKTYAAPPSAPVRTTNLERAITFAGDTRPSVTRKPSRNLGTSADGLPKRGLSVRTSPKPIPDQSPGQPNKGPLARQNTQINVVPMSSRAAPAAEGGTRLTEIYDDYHGPDEEEPPLPPVPRAAPAPVKAVASPVVTRGLVSPSARSPGSVPRPPPSAFGGSASGVSIGSSGSLRRKVTRRGPGSISRSRGTVYDDDDEEGYVSGEYEDGLYELTKIRVKIHYQEDVRGMTFAPDVGYDAFVAKIADKFNATKPLTFKFKDEDGTRVSLLDESDYDLAIETARESAKGKPEGKLEMWCVEE